MSTLSRDKALQVFDALIERGYGAVLVGRDHGDGTGGHLDRDETGKLVPGTYHVQVARPRFDRLDLRKLVEFADEHDVDIQLGADGTVRLTGRVR